MEALEIIKPKEKTMRIYVSTGLPDIVIPTDLKTLLELHRKEANADPRGRGVLERQQGAFTSTNALSGHEICVREEFGFRGHVVYMMTPRERISDAAEWLLEFEMDEKAAA